MFSAAQEADDASMSTQLYSELPLHLALFSCGVLGWAVTRWANQRISVPRKAPTADKLAELEAFDEPQKAASSKPTSPTNSSKAKRRAKAQRTKQQQVPDLVERDEGVYSQEEPASEPACREEGLEDSPSREASADTVASADTADSFEVSDRVAKLMAKKAERKARKAQQQRDQEAQEAAAQAAPAAEPAAEQARPAAPAAESSEPAAEAAQTAVAPAAAPPAVPAPAAKVEEPKPTSKAPWGRVAQRPAPVVASSTLWADVVATPKEGEAEAKPTQVPREIEPSTKDSVVLADSMPCDEASAAAEDQWDSWSQQGPHWSGGQHWTQEPEKPQDGWMMSIDDCSPPAADCSNMYAGDCGYEAMGGVQAYAPLIGEDGQQYYTDGEQVYMMACVPVLAPPQAEVDLSGYCGGDMAGADSWSAGQGYDSHEQESQAKRGKGSKDGWDVCWGLF